jgi:hypothetical protein
VAIEGTAGGNAPGFEVGYDQITSPVTVSSMTEATGTAVISCAAHTFDGAPVLAHFFASAVIVAASDLVQVSLFESTTEIGIIANCVAVTALQSQYPCVGELRFTPTAGAHTYTVTAYRSSTNGTVRAGAGGTATFVPAFIRFVKV